MRWGVILEVSVVSNKIIIVKRGQFLFIPLEEVYYIERLNQCNNIKYKDEIVSVRVPLKTLEAILPDNFVRSHRSFIINKQLLRELTKQDENNYEAFFFNIDKTALVSKMYFGNIFTD